jgi:5,10-methylenetetrahydromethanopterin reductase
MLIPKIGIRLHGSISARECVERAQIAESAGLEAAWFAENAFARGILPAAAACAIATKTLQIRAGVFNPFSRHPTMMAMEIGALDELSGGRAGISIGAGIGSAVEKIGSSAAKPIGALRDTIAILRSMLAGETCDHEGKAFSARGVRLEFKPRKDIPIFLAGRGEMTLGLCGQATDGLIVSNMCAVDYSSKSVNAVQAAARGAGRSGQVSIVQYMPCSVRRDPAEAVAAAKRMLGELVPGFWSLSQRVQSAREALFMGTGISADDFAAASARIKSGDDPATVLDSRFVDAFAIAGTPAQCLEQVARYGAAGVTEIALTFDDGCSPDDINRLGHELARTRKA